MIFLLQPHLVLRFFVHKIWIGNLQPISRRLGVLNQLDLVRLPPRGRQVDPPVDGVLLLSGKTLQRFVKILQLTILVGSDGITWRFLMLHHQLLLLPAAGVLTAAFFLDFPFFAENLLLRGSWSLRIVYCYFDFGGGVAYLQVKTLLHVIFTWSAWVQRRYLHLR